MFRRQFLIGCLLIVSGIAWPTVSIVRGLTHFSSIYQTAAREGKAVRTDDQTHVIHSVERGVSSIVGGLIVGLLGIGLALDRTKKPTKNGGVANSIEEV